MVQFNHTQGFDGMCAPFIHIEGCTKAARQAYMNAARVWLPINSIVLIALVSAFIYRYKRVSEPFNTLRLAHILFTAGLPFHIVYDALRVNSVTHFGAPPSIMGLLWSFGYVPPMAGVVLLVVTWISFASKDLFARPVLTGHPLLFWGIMIPFTISCIVFPIVGGVRYWYYFVTIRIMTASWSALFLILAFFGAFYGYQTLSRLRQGGDSFNYKQQMRILVLLVNSLGSSAITTALQAYFLDSIDNFYQMFILCSSIYRLTGVFFSAGTAIYVWYATSHHISTSASTRGALSDRRSNVSRSKDTNSSKSTSTSSNDSEEDEDQV